MGTVVDAYGARKQQEAMGDTWGHLKPKKDATHKGYMLWAYGSYGDIVLLNSELEGLDDSPWLYEAMQAFIGDNIPETGVFRWEGVFENFEFTGKITKIKTNN